MRHKISGELCNNFISQTLGLMFRRPRIMIFALPAKIKIQIHTWFVFRAINVYFLNENKRIIEIVKDLKPFRFYTSKKSCKWIVETPNNINFRIGDIIQLKESLE